MDLHLGQSAEKTGKDQGDSSASEKLEESGGGFLAAPAGIFHFGVNKTISQHLERISDKGIGQEKRVLSRLISQILIKAAPSPQPPPGISKEQ